MNADISFKLKRSDPQRGMALVIVLASLIFLAALALAFFSTVHTELQSSKSYAEGASSRLLAQSAVNLAISQINAGTRGVDNTGAPLAWASQPGMIRTYDAAGKPAGWYKLFTSSAMTGTGAFDPYSDTEKVPSDWARQTAIFTDLNQPMTSGTKTIYPILDPGAKGNVEGFDISPDAPIAGGSGSNPAPMPVRWLYVLADGTVVAPQSDAGGIKAVVAGATDANPITGRIAFWADDESCKLNINTSSEGVFTDTPRAYSTDDFNLAVYQPAQHEYQRYPGHPAMTSLSTVFKNLTANQIYSITPRITGGGSEGGTQKATGALNPDPDRLYASIDEIVFKPILSSGEREQNNAAVINQDTLEQNKFFLTASSRAPDVNLFNQPRISMWPLSASDDATHRTAFDRLIAFCSTMRNDLGVPYRYYFTRQDPNDATTDLPATPSVDGLGRNRMLLEYLRSMTSQDIPGFGGSFAAKYGNDRNQILTEMFDYIRCTNLRDSTLTDAGKYTQKLDAYNGGVGQVIPIVDSATQTRGFGRFPTVQSVSLVFIGTADNATNPTDTTDAKGNVIPRVEPGKIRVQAGFFVQLFDPSLGLVQARPWFTVKISGLDGFRWDSGSGNPVSMGFPASAFTGRVNDLSVAGDTYFGGIVGFRQLTNSSYPFISAITGYTGQVSDMTTNGTFNFTGGDVKVDIYALDSSGKTIGDLIQTVTITFPSSGSTPFPVPSLAPDKVKNSNDSTKSVVNYRRFLGGGRIDGGNRSYPFLSKTDVVRSIVATPGDIRLIAAREGVKPSDNLFAAHEYFGTTSQHFAHMLRAGNNYPFYGGTGGKLANVSNPAYNSYRDQYTINSADPNANGESPYIGYGWSSIRDTVVPSHTGVFQAPGLVGDWDNGIANQQDGAYINKADEGDIGKGSYQPYFGIDFQSGVDPGPTYFSPNRLIPSPVMFGSLPTGVLANRPWQTLLFRPDPTGLHAGNKDRDVTGASSPGQPPDSLFLDLFHMPVVEPYAISEPLSTAGRVNMNYQMVPFTYLTRDTAIRAVLKSEKLLSIPDAKADTYKTSGAPSQAPSNVYFRKDVDADKTLEGFARRFNPSAYGLSNDPDIFRSAAEICGIHLVPSDAASYSSMSTYWDTRRLTGDNSREKPYADIYPRLTTKSNTFTIHYRAQSLKKAKGGDPTVWREGVDRIVAEDRGAEIIERYIDPNDQRIPDYAQPGEQTPIGTLYKMRVINAKEFAP
ncbi:MAG: hypothetical protein BGO12_15675 [Verrucomicrobia bacterium 61-8]|nr:Verru_Chthon cassette protein A [Verrucomicrobiota bacterium]OJV15867.1 MAG: hypothetical protein BGO12_15675 [Verrucomicrobia bacterium 61-8]